MVLLSMRVRTGIAAAMVFDWIKEFNDTPAKATTAFNKIRLMDLEDAVDLINASARR